MRLEQIGHPPGALNDLRDVSAADPTDGDIIRWNAEAGAWESCAEPLAFQGILLIPMTLPDSPAEGFVGYKAADNGLYVAVE